MTFVNALLFLFALIPGYRPQSSGMQLWRAEDVTSEEVLANFDDRAHLTDEIWKKNNTIDFTIHNEETDAWRELLDEHNIVYTVLNKNITGQIDAKFLKEHENTRRGGGALLNLEDNTAQGKNVTKKIDVTAASFIPDNIDNKNNETTPKNTTTAGSEVSPQIVNNFSLPVENGTEEIDEEFLSNDETRRAYAPPLNLKKQPTFYEISVYLHKLAAAYPDHVSLNTMDKTLHKNDIFLVKITDKREAPIIMIESGIHGNDWAAILATLNFIDNIARNFTKQPAHVREKDWYIIPVLNPDGYDYSVKKDKKWMKNTHYFGKCKGVNINRNFDYNWGGGSNDACNQFYHGDEAASEKETRIIMSYVKAQNYYAYISIHSVGGQVFYPSARDGHTHHFKTHFAFAREIAGAMRKVADNQFTFSSLVRASGVSIDWVYHVAEVTHSYVINAHGEGPNHDLNTTLREVRAGLMKLAEMLKVHHWPGTKR